MVKATMEARVGALEDRQEKTEAALIALDGSLDALFDEQKKLHAQVEQLHHSVGLIAETVIRMGDEIRTMQKTIREGLS
ncbi:MAG: hypothetical protein F4Y08_06615 [Caldilineaceae bacterium SB0662_bin_9]|uniref:Uncharacterized protein n=1 Tax=Caldilineaceae bacterium SB0662_bin_9 TaxID=2605258 RepID=A0A6B1DRU5_9CHLR|nr:hypothetical protein [Caldilineaceae bacterium SB0662_bin_9]